MNNLELEFDFTKKVENKKKYKKFGKILALFFSFSILPGITLLQFNTIANKTNKEMNEVSVPASMVHNAKDEYDIISSLEYLTINENNNLLASLIKTKNLLYYKSENTYYVEKIDNSHEFSKEAQEKINQFIKKLNKDSVLKIERNKENCGYNPLCLYILKGYSEYEEHLKKDTLINIEILQNKDLLVKHSEILKNENTEERAKNLKKFQEKVYKDMNLEG